MTLFEVGVKSAGVDIVRYLSTKAYTASANTPYQAVVAVGLKVTESISPDSAASLSAGDIEIHNADGARDSWLDDIWVNQPVNAYVGDVRWDRADFRQVFSGVIVDIGCKSRDRLSLRLVNKLERLNTPVTDVKIGGNATNPDALVPVLLGECHNISPVQTNPVSLEYAFGDGSNEAVAEVRTEGKPRGAVTVTPNTGRLVFNEGVGPGVVTCDAQGVKYNGSYVNTISQLVQYLVTQRGKAATRFTAADLDAVQLAAFDAANPQPVGLYLTDRTNVLVACQQLASSVGAQLVPSMTGKLRLIQFALPAAATAEILPSQQLDRSITIVRRTEVAASVKVGYCRNWTPQDKLQTSLPDAHKTLYAQQWLSVTAVDAGVQATYKLDAEPVQIDTCLLRKVDGQAEANRRLAIVKVPRTTYRFDATPAHLMLELGQAVKLFSNRFGLAAGKVGQLTSRTADWDTLRSTLEVTV
ncbi:hypothetical protein GM658_12590 [Pseudoduganella eburnea]|uniref:Tail protein n=1 Tax=Massilia eburnea TaxID=1776165 RepID=A0A6L6QGU4_9BURK|nr:hypothetical protein [Massilia eburnea]MTW11435.1 hypothetical protein [Massilia eburnea]